MRLSATVILAGGLALAGCAPYGVAGYPGYDAYAAQGYGYSPYGGGGYYAPPVYAQSYGYARPTYVRPYQRDYDRDRGRGGGEQLYHSGYRNPAPPLPRSNQPAQVHASPQTKSFERALGFAPNP